MPLSRRRLLAGTLGGAAAAALAGCGGENTNPVAGQSTEVPTEPTTLKWWCHKLTDRRNRDLSPTLVAAFERAHPTIRVEILKAPSDTDTDRAALTTQIASGSASPDVFTGDVIWPGQFAYNSLALPLNDYVPEGFWDRYPEALVRASSWEGKVYAFPFFIDQSFLYYRRDLLHKHGLPVPRTWEELVDTARRVRASGDVSYGLVWQASVYEGLTVTFSEFLADAGGALTTPDSSRVTVDSPAARHALGFMRELVTKGVSPRAVTTYIEQDSLDAFLSGRALFMRNWAYAWAASNAEGTKTAGRVGVVPRPGFDGRAERGHSGLGGWSNYINPHTKNLGAALAFARWLAEDGQRVLLRESSYIPTLDAVLTSEQARALRSPIIDNAPRLRPVARPSTTPHYPKVSKAVYTHANSAVSGSTSIPDALSAMASQMQAALEGAVL